MTFPLPAHFLDFTLLASRLMVAAVFITSGSRHLKDPAARSQSIGMSKTFTIFLGAAEVLGSLGIIVGVLTQLAAAGLVLISLGAIQKKLFVWHSGFWGESGYDGWHYDLMFVLMNLIILSTNGGQFVLMQ